MNKKNSSVIIVEGKNDLERVKRLLPDIPVLTTNGSALSQEFLITFKKLSLTHRVILLLDPDYNGESIRKKLTKICPDCSHVFVRREDARSRDGKKIGVEHVPLPLLKEALRNIKDSKYNKNIVIQDLYFLGLAGSKNSRSKRQELCDKLGIGYVNAKGLVERLNLFNYKREDLEEML